MSGCHAFALCAKACEILELKSTLLPAEAWHPPIAECGLTRSVTAFGPRQLWRVLHRAGQSTNKRYRAGGVASKGAAGSSGWIGVLRVGALFVGELLDGQAGEGGDLLDGVIAGDIL